MSAGTYIIRSGAFFYVGSSSNLKRRKQDHLWRLRAGIHPAEKLQSHFSKTKDFQFIPKSFSKPLPNEPDSDFRDRLRKEEQTLLNELFNDPNNENKSPNARGPNNLQWKEKWQDPQWRAVMIEKLKARSSNPSPETRKKMSIAKRGDKNAKSRPVIVTNPDGSTTLFPCASDAARHFNVKQQTFDLWIKGTIPWPGQGKFVRPQYAWIANYSAKFA
jgi:hypothetical protein